MAKKLKDLDFKNNDSMKVIHNALIEMKSYLTNLVEEKIEMLKDTDGKLKQLAETANKMEMNKILEVEMKKLKEKNEKHSKDNQFDTEQIKEQLKELNKKEYF